MTLEVYGENAYVMIASGSLSGENEEPAIYEAENGVVSVVLHSDYQRVCIGNAGEETAVFGLDCKEPLGTYSNPEKLKMGENTISCVRDDFAGYYLTFTATCDGTLSLMMPEGGWMCMAWSTGGVDIFSTYADPGVANPIEISVKKGDVVTINVDTFDAATFRDPAGDLLVKASVVYDHNFADGVCTDCGAQEQVYPLGDVNCDGKVTAGDARMILRYVAGLVDQIDDTLADFNGDGKVTVSDARAILKAVAGIK